MEERGFFYLRGEYLDRNKFNDVRARVCALCCLASSVGTIVKDHGNKSSGL